VLQLDPTSGVPLLTAREHQVLEFVAQGLSAKEVAQEIDIAPRTVERHIENVRLKIRARNRTHMVTLAVELGLLVIDAEPTHDLLESAVAHRKYGAVM
jgi:DNA-binding CsgD family transcriptional regulator